MTCALDRTPLKIIPQYRESKPDSPVHTSLVQSTTHQQQDLHLYIMHSACVMGDYKQKCKGPAVNCTCLISGLYVI